MLWSAKAILGTSCSVPTFVALLRAVNVGGTGKLAMSDLRALCERIGLKAPRTYIQSGNVVFESALTEPKVKAKLDKALSEHLGKPAQALVRTAAELAATLAANPFAQANPSRVAVFFLDRAPPKSVLKDVVIPGREELSLKGRELFVHYPDGQGRSKLKLPFAKEATARNLNTVRKLVEMARAD